MKFDWLGAAVRWIHILSAITAVGGTIFVRFVLLPSVGQLPDDVRKSLHELVRSRWSKIVAAAIGLLLLSGLYNIGAASMQYHLPGFYMPLFLVKLLLAFAIFFVASALTGKSAGFEPIRRNARFWLTLNVAMAVVLVCISGVLRMAEKTPKTSAGPTPAPAAVAARP